MFIIYSRYLEKTDNPSIRICVNKIKNRITFKIKRRYYVEVLTPETMKLINKIITKDENGKNDYFSYF